MSLKTITPEQLKELIASGQKVNLIDVRTPAEFAEIHVQGARLIPLDQFDPQKILTELNGRPDEPVYMICRSGNRARTACDKLIKAGCLNVVLVEGGTLACEQAGVPVVRGQRMLLSIEQQARIVIGLGVLIFSLLGYFVDPLYVFGAAFFGLGQIYVGLTNNCVLALLLARMPWNRRMGGCAATPPPASSDRSTQTGSATVVSTCTSR
ncbi:MAG: rhodanese-like domain-containing protein [Gemmataceae bacterium]|nr:rhodanese-like domain-containing protein [Gemmataceae bacterium]MDW8241862.1 rhodanese-like domain-containing protein [Thermogemmata sp.]